jgi:hypothetical protein
VNTKINFVNSSGNLPNFVKADGNLTLIPNTILAKAETPWKHRLHGHFKGFYIALGR